MTAESAPQHDPSRSAASPLRRFAFAVTLLALLVGLCSAFFIDPIARGGPKVHDGRIDFAGWGPPKTPVPLKGDWRIVWLTAPAPGAELIAPVPADWAGLHVG